jgi:hypothetical protein
LKSGKQTRRHPEIISGTSSTFDSKVRALKSKSGMEATSGRLWRALPMSALLLLLEAERCSQPRTLRCIMTREFICDNGFSSRCDRLDGFSLKPTHKQGSSTKHQTGQHSRETASGEAWLTGFGISSRLAASASLRSRRN